MLTGIRIGPARLVAAALLLAFAAQAAWLAAGPAYGTFTAVNVEVAAASQEVSRPLPHLLDQISGFILRPNRSEHELTVREVILFGSVPYILFGMWLGAALWWVTHRLYGTAGAVVALSLYCFSVPMLLASAGSRPDVLAAWGIFGTVFTCIGVAHVLYGPAQKLPPRTLLLGTAIGLTAATDITAVATALLFGAIFIFYLVPERRRESALVLAAALALGAVIFALLSLAWHGSLAAVLADARWWQLEFNVAELGPALGRAVLALSSLALLVWIIWKRARYFGNTAPLLVALPLLVIAATQAGGRPWVWALPFLYAFIGGIAADLLESQWRRPARALIVGLVAAHAISTLLMLYSRP